VRSCPAGKYVAATLVGLVALAGCRNMQAGSWSARDDVLLRDGVCSVFERGLLYSEVAHNAPRREVLGSMTATMRLVDGGVEVVAVSSCPAAELERQFVPGPENEVLISARDGLWRIRELGSGPTLRLAVEGPQMRSVEFPWRAVDLDGSSFSSVAIERDAFYVVIDKVDERAIAVGDLNSGSFVMIRIDHRRLFDLEIGERFVVTIGPDS
jgi:hypothetical protein